MSAFSEALTAAHQATLAAAGGTVTLTRDGVTTAGVKAVPGRTTYATEDIDGTRVRRQRRDFLVTAAAYVINGQAVEPAAGDVIVETFGDGRTATFEVHPIASNSEPWEWRDSGRTLYRVHTRSRS